MPGICRSQNHSHSIVEFVTTNPEKKHSKQISAVLHNCNRKQEISIGLEQGFLHNVSILFLSILRLILNCYMLCFVFVRTTLLYTPSFLVLVLMILVTYILGEYKRQFFCIFQNVVSLLLNSNGRKCLHVYYKQSTDRTSCSMVFIDLSVMF